MPRMTRIVRIQPCCRRSAAPASSPRPRRRGHWLGITLALAMGFCVESGPAAESARADAPVEPVAGANTTATATQTAAPFFVAIQEGLARLREGDAHAAQIVFQRALAADRTRSEGHYLLGVAMRRNQSFPAALDSFREALAKAQLASDLAAEGRARVAIAETLSHVHGRHHEDPLRAWQELLVFAEANPTVVAPEIPRAHIQATTHVAELVTTMAPVRERIRAREHEARTTPAHGHGSHR